MKLVRTSASAAIVALASLLAACGGTRPSGAKAPEAVSTTTVTSAETSDGSFEAPRVGKSQRATARLEDLREPKRLVSREGAHKTFEK